MDSLQDILSGRGSRRQEPPEMAAIKQYVLDAFQENVSIVVREAEIIITCPSAALASALRMRVRQLRQACDDTSKRLVFRIG